ncbi:MAG: NYN domain-containing protein [Nitrospirota bacterium]
MRGGIQISNIIIDGYNLIGVSHRDLKKQRDMLIDSLIKYKKRKGHEIIVVFDGWKTGAAQETRMTVGGIRVIYSRIGDMADVVIKRIISSERHEWIVVTSDRDIAHYAWTSGSIPISAEDFLRVCERNTSFGYAEEEKEWGSEEESVSPRRKGNPRRLSKKEKAIMRALNKL